MITIAVIFVVPLGSARVELLHGGLWELAHRRRA